MTTWMIRVMYVMGLAGVLVLPFLLLHHSGLLGGM